MPIPIQTLKFNIIDVVASGDLPLQALLQANVDMLWSLNQRRSTSQVVQYLYCLSDALRMGMEFTRSQIDAAQTDSDTLDVKRGKSFSNRAFDAQNSSSGFTTISISGNSSEGESSSRVSDATSTSRQHSDHLLSMSTTGSDRSRTASSMSRDTGESMVTDDNETNFVTDIQFGDTNYEIASNIATNPGSYQVEDPGDIFSAVRSVDVNSTIFATSVRFGYADGGGSRLTRLVSAQQGNVGIQDVNPGPWSTYSKSTTDTYIDGLATATGRGTLAGGLAEQGSGTNSITRNAHSSGASTTDDHASASTAHNMTGTRHQSATMSALQTTASDGHSVTSSSSTDLSHGETHDVGESNERMTATIDYLGQLFDNLKMMYLNVCEQIKAFEPQIAVGGRYANQRMTTRMSPLPKIGNLIEFGSYLMSLR